MATIINASTSVSSLNLTGDTSGILQLQSNGTTQQTIDSTGSYGQLKSGTAVASTSGTSIDFTSIPSWVKRITVNLSGVSTNGTSVVLFQLGISSGVTTSGYLGSSSTILDTATGAANYTIGFGSGKDNSAANLKHGCMVFNLLNSASNLWACFGVVGASNEARVNHTGGTVSLSGTLDRVRITTVNGTDTFDAGSINILYEG